MKDIVDRKRRCQYCRRYFLKCDLNNHQIYGLICKECFDKLKKKTCD